MHVRLGQLQNKIIGNLLYLWENKILKIYMTIKEHIKKTQ